MKRLIPAIGLGIGLALSSGVSFVQSPPGASCNQLFVVLTAPGWEIDDPGLGTDACLHGRVIAASPTQVELGVVGLYGPDCRLGFTNSSTGAHSHVDFQQNYCVIVAGDITVKYIDGHAPQYSVKEGQFNPSFGGVVTVTGFQ